jgi:hypothetical protein
MSGSAWWWVVSLASVCGSAADELTIYLSPTTPARQSMTAHPRLRGHGRRNVYGRPCAVCATHSRRRTGLLAPSSSRAMRAFPRVAANYRAHHARPCAAASRGCLASMSLLRGRIRIFRFRRRRGGATRALPKTPEETITTRSARSTWKAHSTRKANGRVVAPDRLSVDRLDVHAERIYGSPGELGQGRASRTFRTISPTSSAKRSRVD